MSRGFVAIWYSGYGMFRPNPNPDTAEFWHTMVMGNLRAWRYQHPEDHLVVWDVDCQFTGAERQCLATLQIGIVRDPYQSSVAWRRTFLDKATAMERTPFDEVCLFDLDMLFVGNISRVFDLVQTEVGVLGYPFYKRNRNRICNALWVVKDRSIWPKFWEAAGIVEPVKPNCDESALDCAIDRGWMRATKLAPVYGMDPWCWLMTMGKTRRPSNRGWCDVEPLRIEGGGWRNWMMGDKRLRAIHLSGGKRDIVGSELWVAYQAFIAAALGLDRMPG